MNRRQSAVNTRTTASTHLTAAMHARSAGLDEGALPRTRIAVMGSRHNHVCGLINAIRGRSDLEIVAACEDDPETRPQVIQQRKIKITDWGVKGVVEGSHTSPHLTLYQEGEKSTRIVPKAADRSGGFLESFLSELRRQPAGELTSADVLDATRVSLPVQAAADQHQFEIAL